MADVFISYAREDRVLASELADFLKAEGIDVWWDEQILSSDDFYEVILAALTRAKAAIVIWTGHSVKSRFVRDEARFALHNDKLIATKASGLEVIRIPFGFQSQHTDDIDDRERILLALDKLGAKPKRAPPVDARAAALSDWDRIRSTSDPEVLLDYLARHPSSPARSDCLERLRQLTTLPRAAAASRPQQQSQMPAEAIPTRISPAAAFISGFSFRMPGFQSLSSGTYAALGGATFYVLLAILIPVIVMNSMSARPNGYPTLAALSFLVAALGFQRFWAWRKQRNFKAAIVTGLAASGIFGLMLWSLCAMGADSVESTVWVWPASSIAVMAVLGLLLYRAR